MAGVANPTSGSVQSPWLSDPSIFLPLHEKYEERVSALQKALNESRIEVGQLRAKFSQKTEENSRLQAEMNNLSMELLEMKGILRPDNDSDDADGENAKVKGTVTSSFTNAHITSKLEQQLRMLTDEKEQALEMVAKANHQLDTLQRHFKERMAEMEAEQTSIKAQYEQGASVANSYMTLRTRNSELERQNIKLKADVEELTSKVNSFSNYFKQSQEEHKTSSNQLLQLRNTQQQLEQIVQKKTLEAQRAAQGEKNMEIQLSELHTALQSLDDKYREITQHASSHHTEKRLLHEEIEKLKKAKEDLEMREAMAVKEVRDAMQLVENAILEKDEALARDAQKKEEITRLRDELTKVYEEAGERTRKEVEEVRTLCNKSVDRLMDDIHSLEMKVAEKQCEVERVFREKKLVESELEKALRDQVTGGQETEQLFEKCIHAEQKLDQAANKIKALQQKIESIRAGHEAEKINLEGQLKEAQKRNKKLTSDMEKISEKGVQLQHQVENAKKDALTAEQAKQVAVRKAAKSVAAAEQDLELKIAEYEARIESLEECHQQSMSEIQRMLIQQQQLGAKWRQQSTSVQEKSELAVREMREEVAMHKKRVDELTTLLTDSKKKRADLEKQMYKMQEEKSRLHEQMLEAQRQLSSAQDHLSKLTKRERTLTNENIKLSSEIDHLKLSNTLKLTQSDAFKVPRQSINDLKES